MIKIISSHDAAYSQILNLRNKVLRIPLGLDIKDDDLSGEHLSQHLAFYGDDGQIVGCLQVKNLEHNTFQIKQMAVLPEHQGHGIGTKLLQAAEALIQKQGDSEKQKEVQIDAREYAIGFYERNGYSAYGDYFEMVSIPHKLMKKRI